MISGTPAKDLALQTLVVKVLSADNVNVCNRLTAREIIVPSATTGITVVIGPSGLSIVGPVGPAGATGEVIIGPAGISIVGPSGEEGKIGAQGIQGIPGVGGVVGFAEYIRTIQAPNNSVPPGTAFTIDTEVFNTVPLSISASAGAGGTVYTLGPGSYAFDYEMSLESAGSVAMYKGATAGTLAIDTNTIAGSTTATTWIHGRAFQVVPTSLVVAISSVVGTAAVTTAGTAAGFFMIRLTILKLA